MTDQKPPSYEGLEIESERSIPDQPQGDRKSARGRKHADGRSGAYMLDPESEYAFDEYGDLEDDDDLGFDEFEEFVEDAFYPGDEFYAEQRPRRPQATLADLAARAALRWGLQAEVTSLEQSNGGGRRASRLTGRPTQICSAAVREAYELLDALAATAAATEDETDAVGLAAAMVPVVAGLAPEAFRALWPAMPALVRGVMGVTRLLHQRPSTRPHIALLPEIVHAATEQLAEYALQGQPVSGRLAAKVLANETGTALLRREGSQSRRRNSGHSRRHFRSRY
jgi:hypothetical protein